jgi:hypothetical protein
MTQSISYRIKFSFPEKDDEREPMLPSIDMFLRALEAADRMIAGSLGLEMDYRRALKELGESHFLYSVSLNLRWPSQILLGSWPDPSGLRNWMDLARQDLFESAGKGADVRDLSSRWDEWAKIGGLADTFVYTAPPARLLEPVLEDLTGALTALGGSGLVALDQSV